MRAINGVIISQSLVASRFFFGVQCGGAPNNADLVPIMEQNVRAEGNQTEIYPLQVLFELLGKKPGDPITPFSVGISIGMGTTMAAFLTVIAALRMDVLGKSGGPGSKAWRQIASKFVRCLRLTCTYEPAANTQEQVKVGCCVCYELWQL
jgi:hypothetical protein